MNPFVGTSFASQIIEGEPMYRHTTLGVGGGAEYFFSASSAADIVSALSLAKEKNIPTTVVGSGSNVLVADAGIKGLVIQNRASSWEILEPPPSDDLALATTASRWQEVKDSAIHGSAYDEAIYPKVLIRADSGCSVQRLMTDLLPSGVTGLEWFSGIPATVGGGLYMNMHGGKRYFGDLVYGATIIDADNKVRSVPQSYFRFAYDWSILHDTHEIVLDAVLLLRKGPVDKARDIMVNWLKQKNESQPKKSTGCVFQNLHPTDQLRLKIPTDSAGYVIDRLLDLNGKQIGGAKISDTHGNFMVNTGHARAEDFAILIAYVKEQARNKLQLDLHEEVQYLGFGAP